MKRNGGYTLIEVLIAMAILMIGIVAIMRALPVALHESRLAGEETVAAAFANAQLSRMRAMGAKNLLWDQLANPTRYTTNQLTAAQAAYDLYSSYNTDFDRLPGAGSVGLQRVTFTVVMPSGHTERFVTYVARQ